MNYGWFQKGLEKSLENLFKLHVNRSTVESYKGNKLIVLLFILYRYLVIDLRCKRFKIKA